MPVKGTFIYLIPPFLSTRIMRMKSHHLKGSMHCNHQVFPCWHLLEHDDCFMYCVLRWYVFLLVETVLEKETNNWKRSILIQRDFAWREAPQSEKCVKWLNERSFGCQQRFERRRRKRRIRKQAKHKTGPCSKPVSEHSIYQTTLVWHLLRCQITQSSATAHAVQKGNNLWKDCDVSSIALTIFWLHLTLNFSNQSSVDTIIKKVHLIRSVRKLTTKKHLTAPHSFLALDTHWWKKDAFDRDSLITAILTNITPIWSSWPWQLHGWVHQGVIRASQRNQNVMECDDNVSSDHGDERSDDELQRNGYQRVTRRNHKRRFDPSEQEGANKSPSSQKKKMAQPWERSP